MDSLLIEQIKLINFRKHRKKIVRFGPGVTTIQGSSYSGKSTIVRALRWVMKNQPAGDGMIKWDTDNVRVRLDIDKRRVTRKRGKSQNLYKLDKKKYTAFKNGVPDEIAKVLNVSDINFQGQFDAHFWFSLSAGEVSRQLNSIVDLEIIDRTLSNLASQQHKTTTTIGIIEDNLKDLTEQKTKLKYARQLDADLKDVELLRDQQIKIAGESILLADLLDLAIEYRGIVKKAGNQASDAQIVLSAGELYQKTASEQEKLLELLKIADELQTKIDKRPPSLELLEKTKKEFESLQEDLCELDLGIKSLMSKEKKLCRRKQELTKVERQFKQVAGNKCPLCGGKIPS